MERGPEYKDGSLKKAWTGSPITVPVLSSLRYHFNVLLITRLFAAPAKEVSQAAWTTYLRVMTWQTGVVDGRCASRRVLASGDGSEGFHWAVEERALSARHHALEGYVLSKLSSS